MLECPRTQTGTEMAAGAHDLVLWHALYDLEVRYWHEVDSNGGASAHGFYTPDGILAVGDNEFRGNERIREFYAWRGRGGAARRRCAACAPRGT
jgi:hypothetical protein